MNSPTTGESFAAMTASGPRWTGQVELIESMLDVPLRRRKPTMWFVNSMSDLFHESLGDEAIDRIFAVMALCPRHTFQVLTKRAERMASYRQQFGDNGYLPNVWLGVSVEDQKTADERIPHLLRTPAAVRFVSYEPALGPVDFSRIPIPGKGTGDEWNPIIHMNVLQRASVFAPHVDWLIVGGESGPGARPFDLASARKTIKQCQVAGVPCFVKQLGASPRGPEQSVPDWVSRLDTKGENWECWPEDLRVRQLPNTPMEAK